MTQVADDVVYSYTEFTLTEPEFKDLSPRDQDRVQRMALRREAGGYGSALSGMWGASNTVSFNRCMRIGESSCLPADEIGLRHNPV